VTPTAIPDCAAVGTHLAAITLAGFSSAKALPQAKRDQFMALRTADLTKRCTTERWSEDRRVCASRATDWDDELACHEESLPTDEEIANAPRELQCDALAQHLADLATGPGGKFAIVQVKMAERGLPFDMAQVATQTRDDLRAKCDRIPWSLAIRTCAAAAKTYDESTHCW
jgi:hypothetical protein